MPTQKKWLSLAPFKCDICGHPITGIFIDGRTRTGPWANMCPSCHLRYGRGLGTGLGQKYVKCGDDWLKVAG